jgi:hypothetical protein
VAFLDIKAAYDSVDRRILAIIRLWVAPEEKLSPVQKLRGLSREAAAHIEGLLRVLQEMKNLILETKTNEFGGEQQRVS